MTKPMVRIHNSETNEIIDREMTDEELAQQAIYAANEETRLAKEKQAETDKEALLAKLGITADEAKLLLS